MKKERIRVGMPQILSACVLAFIVALIFVVGNFAAITTLELTLQELPLSYYLAVIAQVAAGGYLVWQYCFKSMRDIITFSENGVTQRHRAEVVAEIGWNDVMEVGIKWKQFPHSIPGWRLMPDRRCYIVYFSNHRLSPEERACLGQRNHQNEAASGIIYHTDMAYRLEERACLGQRNHQDEAASGIIYHTDMDFRTECRIFVPNPYITKYVAPQCPAFSDLCAAVAVESSIGQCAYVSKDGVVQKMDSLQVSAARRQYRKEIWCGILGFCAYMILLLVPSAILILRDMAG